jgi:glycerol uptake facilitator-like aquaporin
MSSHPNPLSKLLCRLRTRNTFVREFLAELLGTFVLIAFGDASVAQVTASGGLGAPAGDFFAINWGWGVGVTLAVIVAGGVSGAHLNPAVTLAMVVVGE